MSQEQTPPSCNVRRNFLHNADRHAAGVYFTSTLWPNKIRPRAAVFSFAVPKQASFESAASNPFYLRPEPVTDGAFPLHSVTCSTRTEMDAISFIYPPSCIVAHSMQLSNHRISTHRPAGPGRMLLGPCRLLGPFGESLRFGVCCPLSVVRCGGVPALGAGAALRALGDCCYRSL